MTRMNAPHSGSSDAESPDAQAVQPEPAAVPRAGRHLEGSREADSGSDGSGAVTSPAKALNRVTAFRARVRALPGGRLGWRVGVTIVGVAVIVGGIILLPLPGPGWLIIFAGLGILSTEYEWAKRLLGFARAQVMRWTEWVKHQPRWLQAVVGVLGLAFLVAVFAAVYLVLY